MVRPKLIFVLGNGYEYMKGKTFTFCYTDPPYFAGRDYDGYKDAYILTNSGRRIAEARIRDLIATLKNSIKIGTLLTPGRLALPVYIHTIDAYHPELRVDVFIRKGARQMSGRNSYVASNEPVLAILPLTMSWSYHFNTDTLYDQNEQYIADEIDWRQIGLFGGDDKLDYPEGALSIRHQNSKPFSYYQQCLEISVNQSLTSFLDKADERLTFIDPFAGDCTIQVIIDHPKAKKYIDSITMVEQSPIYLSHGLYYALTHYQEVADIEIYAPNLMSWEEYKERVLIPALKERQKVM